MHKNYIEYEKLLSGYLKCGENYRNSVIIVSHEKYTGVPNAKRKRDRIPAVKCNQLTFITIRLKMLYSR
jgi:hypothetical protein